MAELIEDIEQPQVEQPTDKTKVLYDAVSKKYDVGSYDEFSKKLQDPTKRKAFYEGVGHEYELGTFDDFSNKVGAVKKKDGTSGGGTISSRTQLPLFADKLRQQQDNSNHSDATVVVQPYQSQQIEKLVNTLPTLKKQAVRNITLNTLTQQGKPALEGSNSYNELAPVIEHNLRDEDYMPSGLVPQHKEQIRKDAIANYATVNNEKPEDVEANIKAGKYVVDNGKVKEVGGFGDNFGQGVRDFVDNIGLAMNVSAAQSRNNDNEVKYHLNQFNEKKKNDKEFTATDVLGHSGKLLGGLTPYVAAGAVIPGLDVPMMGMSNMGSMQQEIWNDPKMTDEQKVNAIKGSSTDAFMTGALQGAAFHGNMGELAEKTGAKKLLSDYAPTAALKKSFTQKVYDGFGDLLKTTPKDVAQAAAIGAGTEGLNDLTKAREGVKVDFSNIPQAGLELATLDLLAKVPKVLTMAYSTLKEAKNSGYDKTNPDWYNKYSRQTQDALNNIVSAPKPLYDEAIAQLDKNPDPAAKEAKAKIEQFKTYYNDLPADMPKEVKDKALHIIQLKAEATEQSEKVNEPGIKSHYAKRASAYDKLLDNLLTDGNIDEKTEPLTAKRFHEPELTITEHEDLSNKQKAGIEVPKEYGEATVDEKGEGENKTYVPKAVVFEKDGANITVSKPIKIELEEGKTFKDKEAAQKAADEALGAHYYNKKLPEHEKPIFNSTSKKELPVAQNKSDEVLKGDVTIPIKVDGHNMDVNYIGEYKGKKIVKIDGNIHVYDPKNETLFNVALDDSNGQKKINQESNNLETEKKYIDWADKTHSENIKPIQINETTPTEVFKPTESQNSIDEKVSQNIGESKEGENKSNKIQELEKERDAKIENESKPNIKIELVKGEDLATKGKDPLGNKKEHAEIKERYKNLKQLIDCLWLLK